MWYSSYNFVISCRVNFDSPDNFRYKVSFSLFGALCLPFCPQVEFVCLLFCPQVELVGFLSTSVPQVGVVGLLFIS